MNDIEIKEIIDAILALEYGIDDAELTSDLNDDLYMDSLDRIEFISLCEESLEIESLNVEAIERAATVKDLIFELQSKMK